MPQFRHDPKIADIWPCSVASPDEWRDIIFISISNHCAYAAAVHRRLKNNLRALGARIPLRGEFFAQLSICRRISLMSAALKVQHSQRSEDEMMSIINNADGINSELVSVNLTAKSVFASPIESRAKRAVALKPSEGARVVALPRAVVGGSVSARIAEDQGTVRARIARSRAGDHSSI